MSIISCRIGPTTTIIQSDSDVRVAQLLYRRNICNAMKRIDVIFLVLQTAYDDITASTTGSTSTPPGSRLSFWAANFSFNRRDFQIYANIYATMSKHIRCKREHNNDYYTVAKLTCSQLAQRTVASCARCISSSSIS